MLDTCNTTSPLIWKIYKQTHFRSNRSLVVVYMYNPYIHVDTTAFSTLKLREDSMGHVYKWMKFSERRKPCRIEPLIALIKTVSGRERGWLSYTNTLHSSTGDLLSHKLAKIEKNVEHSRAVFARIFHDAPSSQVSIKISARTHTPAACGWSLTSKS